MHILIMLCDNNSNEVNINIHAANAGLTHYIQHIFVDQSIASELPEAFEIVIALCI